MAHLEKEAFSPWSSVALYVKLPPQRSCTNQRSLIIQCPDGILGGAEGILFFSQ